MIEAREIRERIGGVIENGMERVEAMRMFGATTFKTLIELPDGSWWSVTVERHADEAAARASV